MIAVTISDTCLMGPTVPAQATPVTAPVGRFIQHGEMHMHTAMRESVINRLEEDFLNARAGQDFEACGDRQHLEDAVGKSHTRVHQMVHGDPTGAPQRAYQVIAALARHPHTTPFPLIRGQMDMVERIRADELPCHLLGPDTEAALAAETREQAEEDVSQGRLFMALAPLRAVGWDPDRLRPSERMELIAACAQWMDEARQETDRQLHCIGNVRILFERAKRQR